KRARAVSEAALRTSALATTRTKRPESTPGSSSSAMGGYLGDAHPVGGGDRLSVDEVADEPLDVGRRAAGLPREVEPGPAHRSHEAIVAPFLRSLAPGPGAVENALDDGQDVVEVVLAGLGGVRGFVGRGSVSLRPIAAMIPAGSLAKTVGSSFGSGNSMPVSGSQTHHLRTSSEARA